ncbi:MAG: hypothetical protein ACP5IC_00750 [Minisyncoccia bacterium]
MNEQYTQSIEEQVLSEEHISVGFPWKLLIFSVFIFLLSLVIYFGSKIGYENYLSSQIQYYDKQLNNLSTQINSSAQNDFKNFYSQLVNLQNVLNNHKFASGVFSFLEGTTLPNIYYNNATIDVNDGKINLNGIAKDFVSLIQQLQYFESRSEINKTVLNSFSVGSNQTINFSLTLYIQSSVFNQPLSQ